MTNSEMRQFLKTRYNGKYRGKLVDDMSDQQVWCICRSLLKRESAPRPKVQHVVEDKRVLKLQNGDYVIDGEYFHKDEVSQMNII